MNSGENKLGFATRQDYLPESTWNLVVSKAHDADAWTNRNEVFRHLGLDPGIAAATTATQLLLKGWRQILKAPSCWARHKSRVETYFATCSPAPSWLRRKKGKKSEKQKTPWNSTQSGHILAGFWRIVCPAQQQVYSKMQENMASWQCRFPSPEHKTHSPQPCKQNGRASSVLAFSLPLLHVLSLPYCASTPHELDNHCQFPQWRSVAAPHVKGRSFFSPKATSSSTGKERTS